VKKIVQKKEIKNTFKINAKTKARAKNKGEKSESN
jgi:hypothetical protein